MTKVAFFAGHYSEKWMGGVNYLTNLLYAVSQLENRQIKPIVFLGLKTEIKIVEKFEKYAKVIRDPLFDRKSFKWFLEKFISKVFKINFFTSRLLHKNNVDAISHSDTIDGFEKFIKVNWIPDFQHVHLPDFFSKEENKKRNETFLEIFKKSDMIIVSSHDAHRDAENFAPEYISKVRVLQFVSQPNKRIYSLNEEYLKKMKKKYGFQGKFFYVPNQFWKHKNHLMVFKAIKLLKEKGLDVLVLCSGHTHDYRNPMHIEEIENYIKSNNLEKNIKILGLIDYDEVLFFMRHSISVINPSLFEGWSSTVEECKSIGKNMLLSDISIHKEQSPKESTYFDPYSPEKIAEALKKTWLNTELLIPNVRLENSAKIDLKERTLNFAKAYQVIISEATQIVNKNNIFRELNEK